MNVSLQELKMAGQFMQQSRAQTLAEDCLKTAESTAAAQVDAQLNRPGGTLPRTPGFLDIANGTAAAAVGDAAWWDEASHTLPCTADGRYVIEYLGVQDILLHADRYTGRTYPLHAFRITTRAHGRHRCKRGVANHLFEERDLGDLCKPLINSLRD